MEKPNSTLRVQSRSRPSSRGSRISWFYRGLLYVLPLVLFFSYEPVISLGGNESMNFELSLPLLWLVIFDILVVVMMIRRKVLFSGIKKWWVWVLFPVWVTLSVVWSLNVTRGVLTAGILWLIYIAVYGMWQLRELLDVEFRRKWWKWFFGATLFVCAWCFLQCILDIAGVSRECSLLCSGCTYRMFGFPHPDGFAIEPQFMGNLLLAPTIAVAWFILKNNIMKVFSSVTRGEKLSDNLKKAAKNRGDNFSPAALRLYSSKTLIMLFFVIAATLFLTFSRGAIYAFIVGLIVMTVAYCSKCLTRGRKLERAPLSMSRGKLFRAIGVVWLTVAVAFLFTLNLQGIMAQVSPTNDTYRDGVAKVLNQLSLGMIDIRGEEKGSGPVEVVEKPVEKSVEDFDEAEKEEAVFDGYVAESTDTRLRLTGAAITVWRQDLNTTAIGVGLGGAGQALYNNNLSPAPKEIVQNEYASLLLETGAIGIVLLVLTLVLVVRFVMKSPARVMVLSLMIAYAVTLFFFSGLPNALQIYLMPAILLAVLTKK